MTSEPLRTVRDRFSEFVDRVSSHYERVVVTRNGTPAAVLISPEDLESLEETLACSVTPRQWPTSRRLDRRWSLVM